MSSDRLWFRPRHRLIGVLVDVGGFVFMRKQMPGTELRSERLAAG